MKKMLLAAVLLAASGSAFAGTEVCIGSFCFNLPFDFNWPNDRDHHSGDGPTRGGAPEIDPASAMAGLSLLAGGVAVLRGRRRK